MATTYTTMFPPLTAAPVDGGYVFDMTHLDNRSRPVSLPLIALLGVSGLIALGLYEGVFGNRFSDRALSIWCWLYLAVSLLMALGKALRPGPRNWMSPDVVFWIIFTMFHIPYVVFYLIGWADYSDEVFYSAEATNRSMCCVLLCLIGFLIGYELGPAGREDPAQFTPATRISSYMYFGGRLFLFVTAVGAAVGLLVGVGPSLLSLGYLAIRRAGEFGAGEETQRLMGLLQMFMRTGVIIFAAACIMRHRKIVKGPIPLAIVATIVVFFLLTGARSEAAVVAIPLLIGYHHFVRRIRLWLGIPLLAGMVFLFGVIGIGRTAQSLSPSAFYAAYKDYRASTGVNPFVHTLAKTGASLSTVNVACAYVPAHESYWLGSSLARAAWTIVPMPVAGLRGNWLSPSQWVTYRATGRLAGEQRKGWGASIAMEAYVNFGLIGCGVFLAVVGFLLRRIYDRLLRQPTFLWICFYLILMSSMAMWCRNHSAHLFRPVAWTMVIAWAIQMIFGESRVRVAR